MRLNKRGARLLFLAAWCIYFCSYLGRLNYSAVMSELIGTALTKAQAGWISTCFLIAYATGQLVNGMLAERVPPRLMMAVGAVGGGISNILFAWAGSLPVMMGLRLATGLFMSMLWPSMLAAMVRLMRREDKVACVVSISTSMAAGTLVSYVSTAALLKWASWQSAFLLPGGLLAALGAVWFAIYPLIERMAVVPEEQAEETPVQPEPMALKGLLLTPCLLAAVLPVILHGVIKDGVTAWVPAYISEVFGKSPAFSSLVSVLLPLFNLSGAYLARYAYGRMHGNVFAASAVFFGAAVATFCVMMTNASRALALTMLCFALVTSCMMAVNVLLINLLPLEFEARGRSATVSGGLNAIAYGGSALASGLIGLLSDRYGWPATVASWLVMMVAAGAICLCGGRTLYRKAPGPAAGRS